MTENYFPIVFDHEGIRYNGRVTEQKGTAPEQTSYQVLLNDKFFGHIYNHNDHWCAVEQCPQALVKVIGTLIERVCMRWESKNKLQTGRKR